MATSSFRNISEQIIISLIKVSDSGPLRPLVGFIGDVKFESKWIRYTTLDNPCNPSHNYFTSCWNTQQNPVISNLNKIYRSASLIRPGHEVINFFHAQLS